MFYIGKRSTTKPIEDDVYWSSSKTLKKLVKDRPQDFKKTILATHYNSYMAIWHECILHEVFDVARSAFFYNKAKQTSTGFDTTGVGKTHTPEQDKKHSYFMKGNKYCLGRVLDKTTRKKISEARKGQTSAFRGHKHTEATKQHLSQIRMLPIDTDIFLKYREEGLSYSKIGRLFGVSGSTIFYRLKKYVN